MLSSARTPGIAFLVCLLAIGCGDGGRVTVKGKVTKGGQPLKVSEKGMVQLRLVSQGADKATHTAKVEPDGSFTVKGADGKAIPQGKYKVAVVATDPYPTGKDVLDGKFSEDKTPITRDVTGQSLDIDLDKP